MNHQVVVSLTWIRRCFSIISILGGRNCTAREFHYVTSSECIPDIWYAIMMKKLKLFSFFVFFYKNIFFEHGSSSGNINISFYYRFSMPADKKFLSAMCFFHEKMFPEMYDIMWVTTHFCMIQQGYKVDTDNETVRIVFLFHFLFLPFPGNGNSTIE
jgi:hypothetical protein